MGVERVLPLVAILMGVDSDRRKERIWSEQAMRDKCPVLKNR
jgi:hypothetical protein